MWATRRHLVDLIGRGFKHVPTRPRNLPRGTATYSQVVIGLMEIWLYELPMKCMTIRDVCK